jgi:putative ABC transport system permease protein
LYAALAMMIAAVGVYAAFAHAVVLRRREMAIRIALGAGPGAVHWLILREAILLTALAIAVGCGAAVITARSVRALLYGLVPADPVVLGGAAALMLAVAVVGTALPAHAAARADPNSLLKAE